MLGAGVRDRHRASCAAIQAGRPRGGGRRLGADGRATSTKAVRRRIDVVIGDYRNTRVGEASFSVVLLAFNGIFDPRGLTAQLDIFRNAGRHLAPGGYFVVESWVMTDEQRSGNWSVMPRYVGEEHVELQLARFDVARNAIERTLVHLRPSGIEFVTVTDTYASPGELDVMAEVTGFERHARYSGWDGGEFTTGSANHISVYSRRAD